MRKMNKFENSKIKSLKNIIFIIVVFIVFFLACLLFINNFSVCSEDIFFIIILSFVVSGLLTSAVTLLKVMLEVD